MFGYLVIIVVLFVLGSRAHDASVSADKSNRSAIAANQAQINRLRTINKNQTRAVEALCAFTADLRDRVRQSESRVQRGEDFLAEHPKGAGIFTRGLILQGIADDKQLLEGQQRTLRSLAVPLECPAQ